MPFTPASTSLITLATPPCCSWAHLLHGGIRDTVWTRHQILLPVIPLFDEVFASRRTMYDSPSYSADHSTRVLVLKSRCDVPHLLMSKRSNIIRVSCVPGDYHCSLTSHTGSSNTGLQESTEKECARTVHTSEQIKDECICGTDLCNSASGLVGVSVSNIVLILLLIIQLYQY